MVNGVLVGKTRDEAYYQEYKDILIRVIDNEKLPIVYNVNFGHAMPKSKTRLQIREDTEMKNFPLYCPKCKRETIINVLDMKITLPDSK